MMTRKDFGNGDHEPCCDNCYDSIPFLASQWQSSGWPACQEIDAENGQVHRNIFSSLTCLWSQWTFNLIRDGDGDLSEQEFVDGAVEQVVQIQMQVQEYIDYWLGWGNEICERKYSEKIFINIKSDTKIRREPSSRLSSGTDWGRLWEGKRHLSTGCLVAIDIKPLPFLYLRPVLIENKPCYPMPCLR